MPKLNHTGPINEGPKTGRKLGSCCKTGDEQNNTNELGIGLKKRWHSGGGVGKGKRLKYNEKK